MRPTPALKGRKRQQWDKSFRCLVKQHIYTMSNAHIFSCTTVNDSLHSPHITFKIFVAPKSTQLAYTTQLVPPSTQKIVAVPSTQKKIIPPRR